MVSTTSKFFKIISSTTPETKFVPHWRLQQGDDPKHKIRVANELLSEEVPEIIDWPRNSLDISPMDNLCSIIKLRVEKRKPINLEELDKFLHEEWDKVDLVKLNHLIKSIKSRCSALIESKGE
jgi:hypothetical protein